MSNGGWEAGGGQNGFQHLAGLLNAISSQSAMCVGGGGAVCLKDLSLSSYRLDMLKAVDYFMTQGCFFILACLYDWEQTRLIVTKVKSSTGSLV